MKKLLVVAVLSWIGVATADQPSLKVLAVGKDPAPLRLVPKAGTKRTIVMTTKESKARGLEGKVGALVAGPTIRITIDAAIPESSPGKFRLEVGYRKPEVLGDKSQMPKEMLDILAKFEGVKVTMVASSRGTVLDTKVDNAVGAMAVYVQNMQSVMQQVFTEFPDESIGVGGKWMATSTVTAGEMTMKVESTYEVVERSGTKLKLRTSVKGDGKGSGPGNLTTRMTGKSTTEIDLAQVLPTSVRSEVRTEVGLDMDGKRLAQIGETVTEMH